MYDEVQSRPTTEVRCIIRAGKGCIFELVYVYFAMVFFFLSSSMSKTNNV